nr:ras-like protein family member 12 isoform X4 [Taeniopygia guttata]
MSSPASDRTEGPGLGCWGHGEELRAHESPGTWRGGHQAEAPQVSLPEAGGARGAGVCSAGGTVLGVAGAACPAPRRGSFPYKEFGWSPSSGSRARLRLPHSSQPRPCRGRCCPGPALTESPASPPALACKVEGPRMSSMFGKPRNSSERPPQSPLPECNVAILGCRGAGKSGEMGRAGHRGVPVRGHLPHLPLSPPVALTVKFLTKRFISEYDPNLEDTYSSEELVDQQPVLLKVMDTADQVRRCGGDDQLDHDLTTTGLQLSHSSHPRMAPGTVSVTCAGPAPSWLSTASTTGGASRAASATWRCSPCTHGAASAAAPCSCWETSWTWSSTGALSRRDVPRQQVWVPLP